jgi:hypothetical protein
MGIVNVRVAIKPKIKTIRESKIASPSAMKPIVLDGSAKRQLMCFFSSTPQYEQRLLISSPTSACSSNLFVAFELI